MDGQAGNPRVIDLREAARLLGMPEEGVEALADAGYLQRAESDGSDGVVFAVRDVKAFLARLADHEPVDVFGEGDGGDPQALLDALDGRSDEMARRSFDIFQQAVPDAAAWPIGEQATFIEQSRQRFEAILAITAHGEDDELVDELRDVGSHAAWADVSLSQLLVMLRISRDLVVQTAVELAEEQGRHWGLALSLVLTRVLPAVDRLTDAIAEGYWLAVVAREEESRLRHESLVEHASDGVYEVDPDGLIIYANPALAVILGRRLDQLEGASLSEVLVPIDKSVDLEQLTPAAPRKVQLDIVRRDGVRRVVDILAMPRRRGEVVVGYQGFVRDLTAPTDLEAQKNEFLALVTQDLRQPLTAILGLGVTLEGYAEELPPERVRRTGSSIRKHGERISRLADDLYDLSRIESQSLVVSSRPVDLAAVIGAGLFSVSGADAVEVRVPLRISVQADPRRLEQVVANLVENALIHGAAPVVVEAVPAGDQIEVSVIDNGAGVPPELTESLFARMHPGAQMGLALVRGLVEAMGGRVWHEQPAGGGAAFRFTVPTPRVHAAPAD